MTDYLITNSAALLGGVEDASVPGSYNPLFASHALRFEAEQAASLSLPGVTDIWIRADCYYDDFNRTTSGDGFFASVGLPTVDIARIDLNNGAMTFDYATLSNSAPSLTGAPVTGFPDATLFTFDIHIETGAAVAGNVDDYRVTAYVDLSQVGQVLGKADKVNGEGAVRFDFGGTNFLDGTGRFFLSNVLVSDQDTRGRRFRILRPTGPGALATAVGGHAELGDGDPATFAYARTVGDAVTSTLTPGATPPGTIGRVILASHARNASANPNPGQVINRLRIAGTNHDAAGQAPTGASLEALTSEWAVNPDTGLPWTWADLAGLEIGFAGGS
ncbi:hypothetical protein MB818_19855 [Ruegeria sp. 1NDH52C]|uniref:Uncharacterized protein n=1 Tax=Ruegeria alba TaxID=2916756 RepID=A0ABS9P308_9RHOB|nr:hypothetical protein [Ruegeria alba]MCG6560469.1 hypothetical protein [Ruegeria alba]